MGMAERGLGKFRGAYLATKIHSILVIGAAMLEMSMERMEEDTTNVGGKFIPVESLGIGSSQAATNDSMPNGTQGDSFNYSFSRKAFWSGVLWDLTGRFPSPSRSQMLSPKINLFLIR